MTTLRVGIDVGGTFTDVVAVDAATRRIVASVKVPTTHRAPEGVAAGIVEGLQRLLSSGQIQAAQIAFIAHSTTQATNALLEGDVARVGVVALHGAFAPFARLQLRVPPIRFGAARTLAPEMRYVRAGDAAASVAAVDSLVESGVEAVAVSETFGVDRPGHERTVVALARERGLAATSGHEVSSLYGLRARTRTAVLNAAILPTMMRTANMTAEAVRRAEISAPLMIMRSDGGVMDVREVARRPILTMLSGPAAGIAGALLHENVSDGIFLEVGGTSTDCSVIRRGLPQMRPARVGGHRTMLRMLDVRTLGIAGGSLVRVDPHGRGVAALRDVGPRSAHIAGLAYATFTERERFDGARVVFVHPRAGDAGDCLALELADGTRCAPTPTCAANLLGYVPAGAFAKGDAESARRAFDLGGRQLGCSGEELARAVLERATEKLRAAIDELIDDYELERRDVELIGGGGGAAALVPFAAEKLGLRSRLARDAEVISPLGVALALVRDVVERTVLNPQASDILRIRREAIERVVAAGAAPELVEVVVDVDARRNLVRATASGATASVGADRGRGERDEPERREAAAQALRAEAASLRLALAGALSLYLTAERRGVCDGAVVDASAVVRLVARRLKVRATNVGRIDAALAAGLEEATSFGDVGRALPETYLVYGRRIANLGTLAEAEHVLALAREELRGLPPETPIHLLLIPRAA
jgi:N-methylhydantoinase A/oxoprolinase/acetone carboxylase beta subunit